MKIVYIIKTVELFCFLCLSYTSNSSHKIKVKNKEITKRKQNIKKLIKYIDNKTVLILENLTTYFDDEQLSKTTNLIVKHHVKIKHIYFLFQLNLLKSTCKKSKEVLKQKKISEAAETKKKFNMKQKNKEENEQKKSHLNTKEFELFLPYLRNSYTHHLEEMNSTCDNVDFYNIERESFFYSFCTPENNVDFLDKHLNRHFTWFNTFKKFFIGYLHSKVENLLLEFRILRILVLVYTKFEFHLHFLLKSDKKTKDQFHKFIMKSKNLNDNVFYELLQKLDDLKSNSFFVKEKIEKYKESFELASQSKACDVLVDHIYLVMQLNIQSLATVLKSNEEFEIETHLLQFQEKISNLKLERIMSREKKQFFKVAKAIFIQDLNKRVFMLRIIKGKIIHKRKMDLLHMFAIMNHQADLIRLMNLIK